MNRYWISASVVTMSLISQCAFAEMFTYLPLHELGVRENLSPTLAPEFRINPNAPLRTNEWQPLQLRHGNKATTRFGAYHIAQSGRKGLFGNGLSVSFPQYLATESEQTSAPVGETMLTFSSAETMVFDTTSTTDSSKTFQSLDLKFINPKRPSEWLQSHLVTGNAFVDVEYHHLSPFLHIDPSSKLAEVTVFSSQLPEPLSISTNETKLQLLPPGNKFRLKIVNAITNTSQTWLLYVEPDESRPSEKPEIEFRAAFNSASASILQALRPFKGFLRLAIIQSTPVPIKRKEQRAPPVAQKWTSNLGAQLSAPSVAAMYMLWPASFCEDAAKLIEKSFQNTSTYPGEELYTLLLEVLARKNFPLAWRHFAPLMDRYRENPKAFGSLTTPFTLYFEMLAASYMDTEIRAFQKPTKTLTQYPINASSCSIEAVYDMHRGCIPKKAEISFTEGAYQWTYETINLGRSTPNSPLILFPYYKNLSSTEPLVTDYLLKDPFMGNLYAVSSDTVSFCEHALPSFVEMGKPFPDTLWNKLSVHNKLVLINLLKASLKNYNSSAFLNPNLDVASAGKAAHAWANTVRYAIYLLQNGAKYIKESQTDMQQLKYYLGRIVQDLQNLEESWLIQRQKHQPSLPFFIGDSTGSALNADPAGMANISQETSEGNSYYNNHLSHYGYWLGIANAIMQWDLFTDCKTPWIAKNKKAPSSENFHVMKSYIDLFWRDTINPDTDDPDFPYNRHQNPFEGLASTNGIAPTPAAITGRGISSISEAFQFWLNAVTYANLILASPLIADEEKKGFAELLTYCKTNLSLLSTGSIRHYRTKNWPFAQSDLNVNIALGEVTETKYSASQKFSPLKKLQITPEQIVYSDYRILFHIERAVDPSLDQSERDYQP